MIPIKGHFLSKSPTWKNGHFLAAVVCNDENKVLESIKAEIDIDFVYSEGETALFYAVSHGNSRIVEVLLKNGATVNIKDNDGQTPLFCCVKKRRRMLPVTYQMRFGYISSDDDDSVGSDDDDSVGSDLASLLIKGGADVNITDSKGRSPLIYALQDGNENLVHRLFKAGADANISDVEGKSPLIHYAQHRVESREQRIQRHRSYYRFRYHGGDHPGCDATDHDAVTSLLIKASSDVNKTDDEGKTALMYSLKNGNENLAFALIKAGADANIRDKEGKTALLYSLENGNETLIHAMIETCGDVTVTDQEGKTALIYYAENQKQGLYTLQRHASSIDSSGIDSVTQRNVASILMKSCPDVNKTDNKGKTALMYSIQEGNERLACALIDAGADVNVVDEDGHTALFYAAIYNNVKLAAVTPEMMYYLNMKQKKGEAATTQECVIPKLLETGADANSTDKQGKTVLMYFAENEYINVIHQYLKKDSKFKSHFAYVEGEYNQVASVLIKASKDVDIVDGQGRTALTYFLQNSKDSCALELIDAGAEVNISDADGKTAFFYIQSNCDQIVMDRIIKSSTSINLTDNQGKTALICSLQEGNESLACALIEAGADVTVVDNSGRNALFYATIKGYRNVFSKLTNSIDINVTDNDGKTVLMHAVQSGKMDFVETLVDSGAEVNVADKNGKTALIYCAQQISTKRKRDQMINRYKHYMPSFSDSDHPRSEITDFNTSALMLMAGADVDIRDNEGKTALIYSIQIGKQSLACALIKAGADLSITCQNGKTALHYAVLHYRKSVIQDLIDAGADVNLCDNEGKSALIHCAQHEIRSRDQMIYRRFMSRYHDGDHPEWDTNYQNAVATMIITAGADVNITDHKGRTALTYSLFNGNNNLACTLIKAGADVNVVDQDGHTALFNTLKKERENLLKFICDREEETTAQDSQSLVIQLIDAGADVNLTYDKGETPLIYFAKNGNTTLVFALIKAGANVNTADNEGKTALIHCTCQGNLKWLRVNIALALIKADADVNAVDNEGKTALIYSIQNNNEEMVSRLIKAGADANTADHDGFSAIFYGVGNDKIVKLLIHCGKAIINKRDHYGRGPLYYAMNKSLASAQYLLDNGSGLKRKDCYGISISSFFIEHCLRGKGQISEGLDLLVEKGTLQSTIFEALVNSLICRILLIASTLPGQKQHASHSQKQDVKVFLQVINVAKKYAPEDDCQKSEIIQSIIKMIEEATNLCMAIPKILELLVELGANPSYADLYGNTALHYASCLPLAGASQDTVLEICHQLDEEGVSAHAKNHQNETPLLFCLSRKEWIRKANESTQQIKTLVKVCSFLLQQGSSLEVVTQNGKSVFHLIMELFKKGFLLEDDTIRKDVLNNTLELLNLFSSSSVTKGITVNKRDNSLNSPLHIWAMLDFKFSPENKDISASADRDPHALEKKIVEEIFKHLRDCGAKVSDGNERDQTPLHLCKTWTTAKLLIDAGAYTKVLDQEGSQPLLATVKRKQSVIDKSDARCIYPDISERPKEFWKTVVENKLDPWTANYCGASVMSILVESEAFDLAKTLLDVTCEGNHIQTDAIAVSLLNAICKDQSTRVQWKSILVGQILKATKNTIQLGDGKDSPLHYCCRNIVQTAVLPSRHRWLPHLDDSLVNDMMTSVHWTIVKQLLSHGFNSNTLDTLHQSCTDIAKNCQALKDLLTKPLNIDEVPLVIPWKSISKTHKNALAKVARRQECRQASSFWYHQDHIQKGSFGLVFVGINEKDGREVAIKRLEKQRMHRPGDKREIKNLTALADCEQVVRYLFFSEDDDFSYIVLELMEGNLTNYLGGPHHDAQESRTLCTDVVKGLKHLHEQGIIHRDLKPSNILFKTFPKLCLKIADFGLSRCIDKHSTSATVCGSVAGTRCWIAPEVLNSSYKEHSMASDVFSCGLLLHYILIAMRHPFSPVDCADKSEMQIHNETEANLLRDKREGWEPSLFPEATDLIESMLQSAKTKRPTAAEALVHPMFWPKKKKMDFLTAVGNQPEIECPRAKKVPPVSPVENDLEKSFATIIKEKTWDDPAYVNMPIIYAEMTGRRKYDTTSVVELVRFIRNTQAHVSEDKRPTSIRKLVLEDFVFLDCFPNLVMEVYNCIKTHGWDASRDEIKYALDDEMTK